MIQELFSVVVAVLSLYTSVILINLEEKEKDQLTLQWGSIIKYTIILLFTLFVISIDEILSLYFAILGRDSVETLFEFKPLFFIVFILLLVAVIGIDYEVFRVVNGGFFNPKINMKTVTIINSLAVFWLYLNFADTYYPEITYTLSMAVKGIFIVSIVLIAYTSYLLVEYFKMLKGGVVIVQLNPLYFLFQISLALSLIGFAGFAELLGYDVIGGVLIAAFGMVANYAISNLGRGIKSTLGIF